MKQLHLWWQFCAALLLAAPAPGSQLTFVAEPISSYVYPATGRAIFKCQTKPASSRVSWLLNGNPVLNPGGTVDSRWQLRQTHHKLTASLNHGVQDPAYFQCLASYRGQTLVSNPAKFILAVFEDFPPHDVVNISVVAGNVAVIPCSPPHGVPSVFTEFLFNGSTISHSTDHYLILPPGNLHIKKARANDSGEYRCQAYNPYMNLRKQARHSVFLTVTEPGRLTEARLTAHMKPTTRAVLGSNVTLECAAVGNPPPDVRWNRKDSSLPVGRHHMMGSNLVIQTVMQSDEGIYTCSAINTVGGPSYTSTRLHVQVMPEIVEGPVSQKVEAGQSAMFHCNTRGHPEPVITWIHNGKKVSEGPHFRIEGRSLTVESITEAQSGIYQCFASNELGSTSAAGLLSVVLPGGRVVDGWTVYNDATTTTPCPRRHRKRKKHKGVKMVAPTAPEVTQLSESAAMLRWEVPNNDGLKIDFFRVQYKRDPGGEWRTVEDEIPGHLTVHSISGLRVGKSYRFRIAAVYSNHDNLPGPLSHRFKLTSVPAALKPSEKPRLVRAVPLSISAIELTWEYSDKGEVPVAGFIVYYRAVSSAGEYSQVYVQRHSSNSAVVSHLLPGTGYEFKLQAFNDVGTSEFSNIMAASTKRSPDQGDDEEEEAVTEEQRHKEEESRISTLQLAGAVSGCMVVVALGFGWLCCCRTRFDKIPAPNTTDEEPNNFELSKVNLSINPMAQEMVVSNNNDQLKSCNLHVKAKHNTQNDSALPPCVQL